MPYLVNEKLGLALYFSEHHNLRDTDEIQEEAKEYIYLMEDASDSMERLHRMSLSDLLRGRGEGADMSVFEVIKDLGTILRYVDKTNWGGEPSEYLTAYLLYSIMLANDEGKWEVRESVDERKFKVLYLGV